jgi:hypothetical protein
MASSVTLIGGVELAKIPVDTDLPWFIYRISLSSTLYTLRFRFNSRMNRWILDIANSQDSSLITSIPLLILRDLNTRFVTPGLPAGGFFCVDDTVSNSQPTRLSFGTTHTLWYYDTTGTTF